MPAELAPLVSVVMPTYRQEQWLPAALRGIARQTWRRWELIVVIDGDAEESRRIYAAEIAKSPGLWAASRLIVHEENRGSAEAINTGIAAARGQWLTWVSSDNLMYPAWLDTLLAKTREDDVGAVYSAFVRRQGERARTVRPGPMYWGRLLESPDCFYGPSFIIRRDVWLAAGQHRGGTAHDYDHWARVEEECRDRSLLIEYVDEQLCDYHAGPHQTFRQRPWLYDAPEWQRAARTRRELKYAASE